MARKQSVSSRKASIARRTAALGFAGVVAAAWASPASAAQADPFGAKTQRAEAGQAARCTFGEVILSAGRVTNGIPANGQLLPVGRYSALFALLGDTYGGDGRTTFGLPDLADAAPNGLTYSVCADDGYFPTPVGSTRPLRKLSVRAARTTFGVQTQRAVAGRGRPCYAGEVILSAGDVANGIPADGRLVRKTSSNAELFAQLGTRFGGNGRTNFRLPDLADAAPSGLTYSVCAAGEAPLPSPTTPISKVKPLRDKDPSPFGSGTQTAVAGEPRPNDGWTMGQVTLTAGRVAGGIPANGQSLAAERHPALAALLPSDYLVGRGDRFRLPDLDDAAPDGLTYAVIDEGYFPV